MKPWPLLIGIIIILGIFCSPVLAISKADLLAQYQAPTLEPDDETTFDSFDITESGKFHVRPYDPNGTNELPMADTLSVKPIIPAIEPADPLSSLSFADTPINCDPTIFEQYRAPMPMPLSDAFLALVPSYYEYSKFPAHPALPMDFRFWEPQASSDPSWPSMNYTSKFD